MLVLPGQGILTLLLGIALTDVPGKWKLMRILARRPNVMKALNWMRERAGQPPLLPPGCCLRKPGRLRPTGCICRLNCSRVILHPNFAGSRPFPETRPPLCRFSSWGSLQIGLHSAPLRLPNSGPIHGSAHPISATSGPVTWNSERANQITHAAGFLLSIAAGAAMLAHVWGTQDVRRIVGCAVLRHRHGRAVRGVDTLAQLR